MNEDRAPTTDGNFNKVTMQNAEEVFVVDSLFRRKIVRAEMQ